MTWTFDIDNIAGIRNGEATLERGLNAVRATNWRGKSSFLRAIETAMGTEQSLTEGAEVGSVRLQTDDETYHVDLKRRRGAICRNGNPYLTDPYDAACAGVYAFLGENNEVRHAAPNGENLEAVLTRPLEFENINERIAELKQERAQAETELDHAEDAAAELAGVKSTSDDLEARYQHLRQCRDDLRARAANRDSLRDELEELSVEIERLRTRKDDIKRHTREAFDDAIEEVITRFDTSYGTARLTPDFGLVVARDGREASLDALTEGEVELLGFVATLAGYEAFAVQGRVPVLLMDRLGGLNDSNLHALIQSLRGRAEYLVFTAYPEHAAFDGHDIDPGDWVVVSDDGQPAKA